MKIVCICGDGVNGSVEFENLLETKCGKITDDMKMNINKKNCERLKKKKQFEQTVKCERIRTN